MKKPFALGAAALLVVTVVVISAVALSVRARGKADRPQWRTASVVRVNIRSTVTATGTLQPVVVAPVGAQVSGIVWKLHADFNSHVEAGQVLVELEPDLFRNAVDQAEANLNAALATAAKLRAQHVDAVRTRDRSHKLAGSNFLPQADADSAESGAEAAAAGLAAAQASVQQARAQLERSRLDLAHSVVHSPVTGTVISRNVDVGQAVASSFTAPTLFTIADDLAKMYLHAAVDEADIGQIHVGEKAIFTVDTFRDRRFEAEVHQIRNVAQTQSNVVTYDVVMRVDNPELLLRPGMTANVSVVAAAKADVLAVPAGALRFRPPGAAPSGPASKTANTDAQKATVYVADGRDLRPVAVKTGIGDGTLVEVTGIDQGEEVVVDLLRSKDAQGSAGASNFGGSGRGY